jgi:hypothetical protein
MRDIGGNKFLLDSGASINICNNKSLIINYVDFIQIKYLSCASGVRLAMLGFGSIPGIGEVVFVPSATRNLISISKLTAGGRSVTFTCDKVFVDGVAIGELENNLYVLRRREEEINNVVIEDDIFLNDSAEEVGESHSLKPTLELLHRRFGHLNIGMIERLLHTGAVDGAHIPPHLCREDKFHCDACAMSKAVQHRRDPTKKLRRNMVTVNKTLYFHLVYTDLLGPIQVEGVGGYSYGMTFTENTSRYRYFYPLKKKSDALDAFKDLFAEVSAQGFTLRMLKSDNGGEYNNKVFTEFCREKNIEHRFTAPNTPSSNSVSERYNRVLGERTRAMLYGSKLPNNLWPQVMAAVTYLSNRTISPTSTDKTPYELIYGERPDVSNLRAYGCVAYSYNFDVNRRKLDDKAIKGILVGYDLKSSAYLLYIPETGKIKRSGHVMFNEYELFYKEKPISVESKQIQDLKEVIVSKKKSEKASAKSAASATSTSVTARKSKVKSASSASSPSVTRQPSTGSIVSATEGILTSSSSSLQHDEPTVVIFPSDTPLVSSTSVATSDGVVQDIISDLTTEKLLQYTAAASSASVQKKSTRVKKANIPYIGLAFIGGEVEEDLHELLAVMLDEEDNDIDLFGDDAPANYKQMLLRPDIAKWMEAVELENASIDQHEVFEIVESLPHGKNLIKSMYIFKRKSDGRYKARLVAKGYSQIQGVDYSEVYAPVVGKITLRALLSLASVENWNIFQMDVKTAFLHAKIDDELYMSPPDGMRLPKGTVLKLKKSLYGLKQSPRLWNIMLHEFIISKGFTRSVIDQGVYQRGEGATKIIIAVYVDDILIFGSESCTADIMTFKSELNTAFQIEDLGQVRNILGMQVQRDREHQLINLSQNVYIDKVAQKYRINPQPSAKKLVPITKSAYETIVDPTSTPAKSIADHKTKFPYRNALGALLYANMCCRPDISFAISTLASHCADPKLMHWNALLDLLKYTRDTQDLSLRYGRLASNETKNVISIYADADFARDSSRRSRTGYVIFLNGGPIAWNSSLQDSIAQSTSEAELYAMTEAVKTGLYIKNLLEEIGFPQGKLKCYEDNSGCIDWVVRQKSSSRMKHIETKYYLLRDLYDKHICELIHVETLNQKADFATKQMDYSIFCTQMRLLYNI